MSCLRKARGSSAYKSSFYTVELGAAGSDRHQTLSHRVSSTSTTAAGTHPSPVLHRHLLRALRIRKEATEKKFERGAATEWAEEGPKTNFFVTGIRVLFSLPPPQNPTSNLSRRKNPFLKKKKSKKIGNPDRKYGVFVLFSALGQLLPKPKNLKKILLPLPHRLPRPHLLNPTADHLPRSHPRSVLECVSPINRPSLHRRVRKQPIVVPRAAIPRSRSVPPVWFNSPPPTLVDRPSEPLSWSCSPLRPA